jgi:hypothetical protein
MSSTNPTAISQALSTLLDELLDGAAKDSCWVLNPEDPGLFRSLDKLSAASASALPPTGAPSIAAHVDHLLYGLTLLNLWSRGENPFADADYSASWRRRSISDPEWIALRNNLRAEASSWQQVVREPHEDISQLELTGMVASVVHLAYHLGAIRQLDRAIRGPAARD